MEAGRIVEEGPARETLRHRPRPSVCAPSSRVGSAPDVAPEFTPLAAAYADRLALLQRQAAGSRVAGYVGNTVPVELIRAAGCVPLRIAPLPCPPRWPMFTSSPSPTRTCAGSSSSTAGALDALDLPSSRAPRSLNKLFLVHPRGPAHRRRQRAGPELWLYDIPHTQRASSAAYGLDRTARWGIAWAPWPVSRCLRPGCSKPLLKATSAASCWPSCRPCAGPALLRAEALVASSAWRFMHPGGRARLHQWLPHRRPAALGRRAGLLVRVCRWSMRPCTVWSSNLVRASWPRTTTGVHVPASLDQHRAAAAAGRL